MNSTNLTRSQAARIAGCCEATLRNLDKIGEGPPTIHIGPKLVRYPAAGLHEWLAARTKGGAK